MSSSFYRIALRSLGLLALLWVGDHFLRFSELPSRKVYDVFSSVYERLTPPPAAIKEIVLVGIDSETVAQMKERWPYSRSTFAQVINHLKQAGARAIGLDFSFFGDSAAPEDDTQLLNLIKEGNRVILGATLRGDKGIQFPTLSGLERPTFSGIVNKLRDPDGITRRALTYLVSSNSRRDTSPIRFFSWEMKILEAAGRINLARIQDRGDSLLFRDPAGERKIPVDPVTKTFLIRFRAHSNDIERLSFFQVFTGEFDPHEVRDKIVLLGFLTTMLQDLHRSPIGWIPGVTLNANAFLTLYANDFLRPLPRFVEKIFTALGVFLTTSLVSKTKGKRLWVLPALELLFFFGLSYLLFSLGYVWNYVLFPLGVWAGFFLFRKRQRLSTLMI